MTKANTIMRALHGGDVYPTFGFLGRRDMQGWNSEYQPFRDVIAKHRPAVVFDIGVWKGASTIYLAKLIKEHGIDGAVIAIDTFLGSAEGWSTIDEPHRLVGYKNGRPRLYEQFLTNVVRSNVKDVVVPLAQTGDHAAAILARLGISAGLIHIDAAHDYESVLRDARNYWRLLEPGGTMIGDDYHPTWPGVVKAADEFAREVGQPLTHIAPKWIIRKP